MFVLLPPFTSIIQKNFETKFSREKNNLEKQISELKKENETLSEEHEIVNKDFNAYKTRVHSVLKQQKEQRTDPAQLDQAKQALILAHDQIKKLHLQLELQSSKMEILQSENEKVQNQINIDKNAFAELETSSQNKEKLLIANGLKFRIQFPLSIMFFFLIKI